ncbi:MAG TPA: hypothetical protein VGB76_04135 [Pyrinomonadaceae bacterium]|jgi:hypothetical protein
MRNFYCSRLVFALFALSIWGGTASAQTLTPAPEEELARTRAELIGATQEYKASTENLLRLEEEEVNRSAERVEELRQLFAEGVIARVELEESERALVAARERLEERRQQIAVSDSLISEIKAAEELAKAEPPPSQPVQTPSVPKGSYSSSGVVIRYTGKSYWSIAGLETVQAFFSTRFGRTLPVSALGQTATHNRLGFDHRHAVDIALHPDSVEGRALIDYLQSRGITFIAFRAAVPGSATAPHIHIGAGSRRLT